MCLSKMINGSKGNFSVFDLSITLLINVCSLGEETPSSSLKDFLLTAE